MKRFRSFLREDEERDVEIAKLTLAEEEKAIIDYTLRKEEAKDPVLKKILDFLIAEERNHRQMVFEWLNGERTDPGKPDESEKKEGADI